MELILPRKKEADRPISLSSRIWVVIGANGTGKSTFGKDIVARYPGQSQMISGVRALFISQPEDPAPHTIQELARLQTLVRDRFTVPSLSDYEKLILRLQGEEFEAAVEFKEACKHDRSLQPPRTKIDQIQEVWEKMFPHNRLIRKSGFIELVSACRDSQSYTAGQMSDSEKLVFYLTGAVLCAVPNAILVVEEPETLLHSSIKNPLWDELEALRPDCTFLYLTHDIDFAASRTDSKRIWIRSYDFDARLWDYELIESNDCFPEEVYLDILGSRKPILFIEGTDSNSIDSRLYPLIFPDYKVKPVGGCQKVIETTKSFRELKDFHTLEGMGIVDRDRRTQEEIDYLHRQHIFVPDVAEVENLLMIETVIKTVAKRLMKDPDEVFREVKENVIRLFQKDLESQILLHARHWVRKRLETAVDRKITSVEQLTDHVEHIQSQIDVPAIYQSLKQEFTGYVARGDYKSILRVYNQKGMLPQCRLCSICGISNKESYLNLILSILKENKEDAEAIRAAIKDSLGA
ncbi:MAG: DUF4435 domain-containing protein [Parabacteroides sp.]